MSTPKKEDLRVFIVTSDKKPCGPNDEDLALCFRGKIPYVEFSILDTADNSRHKFVCKVNSMSQTDFNEQPGRPQDFYYWKLGVSANYNKTPRPYDFMHVIDLVYCFGPTADRRWGFFTNGGSRKERNRALESMKDKIVEAFNETQNPLHPRASVVKEVSQPSGLESNIPTKIWITESEESRQTRNITTPLEFISPNLTKGNWPCLMIQLDLDTWTMTSSRPGLEDGKKFHIRMANTVKEIVEQVNTRFSKLLEYETQEQK